MSTITPHPYADILHALADGETIQARSGHEPWWDICKEEVLPTLHYYDYEFRVKPDPEPRQDVVAALEAYFKGGGFVIPRMAALEVVSLLATLVPEVLEQEGGAA